MTTMEEVLQRRGRAPRHPEFAPGSSSSTGEPDPEDVVRDDSDGDGRVHSEEQLAKALGWFSIGLGALEMAAPGAVSDFLGIAPQDRLLRSFGAREIASGIGILTQDRPVGWVWGRAAGDVMDLAMLATALPRSERRGRVLASAAFVAGFLAVDTLCADRLSRRPGSRRAFSETGVLEVRRLVTIQASPDEVYRYWRDLENLPTFMRHVKSVKDLGDNRSHWVAKTAGIPIEWDAEIVDDDPGSMIAWRSVESAALRHAGIVRFTSADPRPGTIVEVEMEIRSPLGPLTRAFSNVFDKLPEAQVEMDLRSLKQLLETGEVATVEGQTSGRAALGRGSRDPIGERQEPGGAREPATEGGRS